MSKQPINKVIIILFMLFVFVLALVLMIKYDFLFTKTFPNQTDLDETSSENDTIEQHFVKQDTLKVDVEGLKNDSIQLPDEIIRMISDELQTYNWYEEFQDANLYSLYHETIFAREIPSAHTTFKKMIVIIYSNHVGNLFHTARGRISMFEFKDEDQSWQMTRKYLAFGFGDEYGLEPIWCNLVQIGNNYKYALIMQTTYSGNGGHDMETQSVYAEVHGAFERVFDFTNYEYYNDPPEGFEYNEGNSIMRMVKNNKAWFDIETKREWAEWNDTTTGTVKRFGFDGKEYVEVVSNGEIKKITLPQQ